MDDLVCPSHTVVAATNASLIASSTQSKLFRQCQLRGFDFDVDTAEAGGPVVGTRDAQDMQDTLILDGIPGN